MPQSRGYGSKEYDPGAGISSMPHSMVTRSVKSDCNVAPTTAEYGGTDLSPGAIDFSSKTPTRTACADQGFECEGASLIALSPRIFKSNGVHLKVSPFILAKHNHQCSLSDLLRKACQQPFLASFLTWHRRLTMATEIAKRTLQLHTQSPTVLYKEIKTEKVVVDNTWHCTFAENTEVDESVPLLVSSDPEDTRYMAPEVMMDATYSTASDVYAFSHILWELLTWQESWTEKTPMQVVIAVVSKGERPDVPADLTSLPGGTFEDMEMYINLMSRCWAKDPGDRPSIADVVSELQQLLKQQTERLSSSHRGDQNSHLWNLAVAMQVQPSRLVCRLGRTLQRPTSGDGPCIASAIATCSMLSGVERRRDSDPYGKPDSKRSRRSTSTPESVGPRTVGQKQSHDTSETPEPVTSRESTPTSVSVGGGMSWQT
eukprot:jgi/Botrbrau1/11235/Bobra.0038s0007.1